MKIGFIGLGAMGAAMAGRLLDAGHEVTVWNRSTAAAEALAARGAKIARTPERAAQGEVLHSMLANDQAVREIVLDGGLLDAVDPGLIHVNHATVSVALTRELASAHVERRIDYLAAPVFGRPDVAAAGKLNILLAGAVDPIQRVTPLLEAMAARLWPLGEDPAQAAVAKIAGNMMLVSAIEAMAEATTLTRAHGLSAADFLQIMTSTIFAAPVYQNYGKLIAEQRYEPAGFAMALGHKDIGLALSAAEAQRVPLPLASLLHDALTEALAADEGRLDLAGLARVAERRAGLDRRDPPA